MQEIKIPGTDRANRERPLNPIDERAPIHPHLLTLLAGLALIIVGTATAATEVACMNPVTSISDLARMSAGDFSANGTWADVALADTSIGYGPAAKREYELTILDGKVYMVKPNGEQVKMRHDPRPDEGLAMLQLASPKAWVEHDELAQINSFDDLNFELDQVVDDLGCNDRVLLPFMIKGHASSMT